MAEARPDSISEIEPGVWYVDLTRVMAAQLRRMLPTIAAARGVIVNANDRWMHTARFARPFAEVAAWQDITWGLSPAAPLFAAQRVFLTDGRAISYAESVMGYVRDYKLGTIVGGTTAGANGNVASFTAHRFLGHVHRHARHSA